MNQNINASRILIIQVNSFVFPDFAKFVSNFLTGIQIPSNGKPDTDAEYKNPEAAFKIKICKIYYKSDQWDLPEQMVHISP